MRIELLNAVEADLKAAFPKKEIIKSWSLYHLLKDIAAKADNSPIIVSLAREGGEEVPQSQGSLTTKIGIDIHVLSALERPKMVEAAGLLSEEVRAYFRFRQIEQCPHAIWIGTKDRMAYDPETIREYGIYASVFTVNYRIYEEAET